MAAEMIKPIQGEQVYAEMEGYMMQIPPNPIAKMLFGLIRIMQLIMGKRTKAKLVVTNHRVAVQWTEYSFWVIPTGGGVQSLPMKYIAFVDASHSSAFLIFKSRYISVASSALLGSITMTARKLNFDQIEDVANKIMEISMYAK